MHVGLSSKPFRGSLSPIFLYKLIRYLTSQTWTSEPPLHGVFFFFFFALTWRELITAGHVGVFEIKEQREGNAPSLTRSNGCSGDTVCSQKRVSSPSASIYSSTLQTTTTTATTESHPGYSATAINVHCCYKCFGTHSSEGHPCSPPPPHSTSSLPPEPSSERQTGKINIRS